MSALLDVKSPMPNAQYDWPLLEIGALCRVKRGASPRPIQDPKWFSGRGHGWVRISDVTASDRVLLKTTQYLSDAGKAASVEIVPGDLIMSICGTIGRPLFSGINACVHDGFVVFKDIDQSRLSPEYLYFFLQAQTRHFEAQSQPGTQRNLNSSIVATSEIPLPSLDEQRRITEVLRSVDDAITAAQAALDAGRAAHRLLLEALFGVCFSERINATELVTIGQVCSRVTYGFTNPMPTTDDGPWMLTAANVRQGWIDYHSARHTSIEAYTGDISDKSRPPLGSILVTKDGTLGRVARVDRTDVCVNQSVAVLIPDQQAIDGAFLNFLLQCPSGQDRMLADSGGSSVKHIYISKLADLQFGLPSVEQQKERAIVAKESERSVRVEAKAVERLNELKTNLMSDLLTGKVRVPA